MNDVPLSHLAGRAAELRAKLAHILPAGLRLRLLARKVFGLKRVLRQ
jgi:hypothetical protein